MTGAEKRKALLAIAAEAQQADLGLLDAALTQIARLDLDDPEVCTRWRNVLWKEFSDAHGKRRGFIAKAFGVLDSWVAP